MPNRIIKESICESEKLAKLTDFEFRLWVSLIVSADDMGRGDARPAIIKGKVFPLRERVTIKDIDDALHRLAAKRCVSLYKVGGKPYYWFPSWTEHQRVREVKPRFPAPEEAEVQNDGENSSLRQSAEICGNLPQSAANCGEPPQKEKEEKEIENEKERSKEKDKEKDKEEIENGVCSAYTREDGDEGNATPTRVLTKVQQALFDRFWVKYPRKVEKARAAAAWKKLNPSEQLTDSIIAGLFVCISKDTRFREIQFTPHPASWLNGRNWENDYSGETATVNAGVKPQKNGSFDVNEFFQKAVARTYKNMNIEEETK